MKILLIGETGQLGWELKRTLAPLGDVTAVDFPLIDLSDEDGTRALVREAAPELIINAAAYTAVDKAEQEPNLAMAINGIGPGILAEEAAKRSAALIHFSTDYVFDGEKGEPYIESDATNPINTYGWTKLAGENNVAQVGGAFLVLRTSWVYTLRRGGFVRKVLEWSRTNPELTVVTDQVGSPTWARMLAEITALAVARGRENPVEFIHERSGIYHLGGDGAVSRYEWARAILNNDPKPKEQVIDQPGKALTSDFPTPAKRPLFTAINCDKFEGAFGLRLPDWDSALNLAMASQEQ